MAAVKSLRWAVITSGHEKPAPPQPIRANPVQLRSIPWGQRDPALARGVCQHIAEATPPTVIPFNPLIDARLRRHLRSMRIHHH